MNRQVTIMLEHIAASHMEMAKILEAERYSAVRMAQLIEEIPPHAPGFDGIEVLTEGSIDVTKSVAAYLNSLADLEDALADQISYVFKMVTIPDAEE